MNLRFWNRSAGLTPALEQGIADGGGPTPRPAKTKPVDSPYLNAREQFASDNGRDIASKQMWQIVAVLGLLTGLAGVGGMVYMASQSAMVPYVVELNRLGEVVNVGEAKWTGNSDPRVIQSFLASWVHDARMVTPDAALQRESIFRVYSLLAPSDPATQRMNAFYGDPDSEPFARAGKELVQIQIQTALPLTKDTWQVDWTETVQERQGAKKISTSRMRATMQVYQVTKGRKMTAEQMRLNPLAIYIKDYTWAKQLDPMPSAGDKR